MTGPEGGGGGLRDGFAQFPLVIWASPETLVAETLVAGRQSPEIKRPMKPILHPSRQPRGEFPQFPQAMAMLGVWSGPQT